MVAPGTCGEPDKQNYATLFEIADKIRPLLTNGGFAKWYYWPKVAFLVGGFLILDLLPLLYGRYWVWSIMQGLMMAWIGLNVQHDANHGAVSKNPRVNRLLGLTQDMIGGSAMGWMISHNVVHHVHCNCIGRDHDLDIAGVRTTDKMPWAIPHQFQQLYIFALEALFGIFHPLYNMVVTIQGPGTGKRAILAPFFETHRAMLLTNVARWAAAAYLEGVGTMATHFALTYCIGGFYLAFFFIISHHYDGVRKEDVDSLTDDFVKNQAETSSNVAGALLAHLNGGLNYQIEHHLFPRIHHSHYATIAPVVRATCQKHGIRYTHFDTIAQNVASLYAHLKKLGVAPAVKKTA